MAKGNYRQYLKGETVRLKKYFYVLRPLLACEWIIKEETPPPVLFEILMDKCLDEIVRPEVLKLIDMKTNNPEITEGKRVDILNDYIFKKISSIENTLTNLTENKTNFWEELNSVFISLVKNLFKKIYLII